MKRYYFYVKFLPETANVKLLVGRCLFILHGFIKKRGLNDLGVSFPLWSESSIGSVIAFVHHDISLLKKLKEQGYFKDMVACGFFEIGEVTEVPEYCLEVRFKRNQLINKITHGEIKRRMRRLKKRAEAQGREFSPKKLSTPREIGHFHLIHVRSLSTNTDAEHYIQKENVESTQKLNQNFNNYGFATNEKNTGTVPDLGKIIN
ncbi:type I-F CRISPR-associated endoribonuclease Cas6/Csy4 [Thalassotalea ganghwensis]